MDTNHHTFPLAEQETCSYLTAIKQWVFYLNLDYLTFSVNILFQTTGNLVFEMPNYATNLAISRPSREERKMLSFSEFTTKANKQ